MKAYPILILFLALSSCAGHTKYGRCIGLFDQEKPELEYKFSKRNALVTAPFIGTIAPPLIWALFYAKCPYQTKETK